MRYFLEIAYSGKNYFGWQRQPNQISVQEVLEGRLSTFLREDIQVTAAGRTDTGVHALQLFVHFNAEDIEDLERFVFKMNAFLPRDIVIKNIFPVVPTAHARFDAQRRTYEYHLNIGKNPFLEGLAYQVQHLPNMEEMNAAARLLLKHTDFQCFSRSRTDVKTYNCVIHQAEWKEREPHLFVFTITADRFLRNMVRAIVGTLLNVGYGKINQADVNEILKSKNRSMAGASAPAHGLYLKNVTYPASLFIEEEIENKQQQET